MATVVGTWNYRRTSLSDPTLEGSSMISQREACELCNPTINTVK